MIDLHIYQDSEQSLVIDPARLVATGVLSEIGPLRHGTQEGRATVSMIITLEDGSQVFAETTWRLFQTAYRVMRQSPIVAEEVDDL